MNGRLEEAKQLLEEAGFKVLTPQEFAEVVRKLHAGKLMLEQLRNEIADLPL